MEKRRLLRNVTIVGILFGLALWVCFYSNLIFKNAEPGFTIVPEIFFSAMFVSFFGMGFHDITNWYIKLNCKSGSDWLMINVSSTNLLTISSTMLIICVATGFILKEFLPKNTNFLEKMTTLWILINLWFLLISIGSRKVILVCKVSEY